MSSQNTHSPAADAGAPTSSLAPIGYLLIVLVVLSFLALLHHPVAHGQNAASLLDSIRQQSIPDKIVHGTIVVTYALITGAMFLFAAELGAWRFSVLMGLIGFSCALVLVVLAGLTDGFIVPAIAETCARSSSPSCTAEAFTLLRFCAIEIDYLTRAALFAAAAAIACWAGALVRSPSAPRWPGYWGAGMAGLQFVALILSTNRFTPQSLLLASAAQAGWYLAVGIVMIRGSNPATRIRRQVK